MTDPISLDVILSDFSENDSAWVLQDTGSGRYVTIPHPKYPGRQPIHFFMSQSDANDLLREILTASEHLRNKSIVAIKVKLHEALRGIASGSGPEMADGFVLHSPNEVYEFLKDRR
jgi:hypothetical protein